MRRVLIFSGALVLLLAACSASPSGNAASFNGVQITNREFGEELNALKHNKELAKVAQASGFAIQTNGKINPELAAQWLAAGVQQIPVDEEFKRRNLQISPEEREAAKANVISQFGNGQGDGGQAVFDGFPRWFQDLAIDRQARVAAVLAAFTRDDGFADDAAWAAGNPQALADYCPSGKVVGHILVKTREEADAVKAELANGSDFATVAKAKSTDTGSAQDGGALGCVQDGQFVPPFEAAMNATAPGTVSDPVQTEYGFHVIRVDSLDATSTPKVITGLRQAAAGRRFGEWLDAQLSGATIVVNPKWGTAAISQGQFTITPPTTSTTKPKPTAPRGTTPASQPGIGTAPATSR